MITFHDSKKEPYILNALLSQYMDARRRNIAAAACCAVFLVVLSFAFCSQAYAETQNISEDADDLQLRIETATSEYDEAEARLTELEATIAENTARIEEIKRTLPSQREKAKAASIALYKFNQEGFSLINAIFNAEGLGDVVKMAEYIDRVQVKYSEELAETIRLSEEAQTRQQELQEAWTKADEERKAASEALSEAKALREQRAATARAQVEEEAKALEAAETTYVSDDGEETAVVVTPTVENVDVSGDRGAFVAQWAARIDAYLSGSPLAGQGATFAAAAWDYGVDPRFSPAISCIESTKGAYCFHDHNAWGWGSVDWDSWEEAIASHVRGLARGYGYTVTVEGAQKYCPPNWEFWYSRVSEEMNKI